MIQIEGWIYCGARCTILHNLHISMIHTHCVRPPASALVGWRLRLQLSALCPACVHMPAWLVARLRGLA